MSALAIPQGPVLWMPITIGVYYGAVQIQRRVGSTPLLNPTLLTILIIAVADQLRDKLRHIFPVGIDSALSAGNDGGSDGRSKKFGHLIEPLDSEL